MLEISGLELYYGGIHALQGVSLRVPDGEIVSLIGANGAGKSSTLNSIAALVHPQGGSVKWNGVELLGKKTKEIVSMGIALVPEGRRVFPNLSVRENLALGAYRRKDKGGIERDFQKVYELFPRLKERARQSAGTLSGGEQQMLAVGRGLMSSPSLFMLDEPSLGLAPLVIKDIFDTIKKINAQGVSVLLVEQNARAALKIADHGYVMETGRVTLSGKGGDLLGDERVQKAYLEQGRAEQ